MASLADLIAARAAHDGPAPFLESATTTRFITYAECADAVHRWRTVLEQNAPIGAAVALSIMDPLDFCLAYLGALSGGYRVLPIDPDLPPALQDEAFAPADLVISDNVADAIPADAYLQAAPSVSPVRSGTLELRSSGTTGPPKLVRLSEKQLLYTATNVARHHRIVPGERGFCPLPLFHINAEVVGLLSTLVGGATLVLDAGFHRSRFWDTVHAHDITWINAVPAIISILATVPEGPASLPRVRFVRSASAPLPETTRRAFEARFGVPVIESYGMTEAASQITVNPLDEDRRPGSAGRPVGVDLQVRDEHGPAPVGALGTVVIRGPGVITSYATEAGNEAVDAEGWLDTGDLGYLDADGFLYVAARRDDIINRGGEKVLPRAVEERLLAHPAVSSAAVVKAPHPTLGEVPEAFVVCRGEATGLVEQLRIWCREGLAGPQVPTAFHLVDTLPVGPTGKVRRQVLVRHRRLAG